jgi:hypothetical protein
MPPRIAPPPDYPKLIKSAGLFKLTSKSKPMDKNLWADQLTHYNALNPGLDPLQLIMATNIFFIEDDSYKTWWYAHSKTCATIADFCTAVKASFSEGELSKSQQRDHIRMTCRQRPDESMALFMNRLQAELLSITPALSNEEMHEEIFKAIHMEIRGEKYSQLNYTFKKFPAYPLFVAKMIDVESGLIQHLVESVLERRRTNHYQGSLWTIAKTLRITNSKTCPRLVYAVSMLVDGVAPPIDKRKSEGVYQVAASQPPAKADDDNETDDSDEAGVSSVQASGSQKTGKTDTTGEPSNKKAKKDAKEGKKSELANVLNAINILTQKFTERLDKQDEKIAASTSTAADTAAPFHPYGRKLGYQGRGGFQGGRGRGQHQFRGRGRGRGNHNSNVNGEIKGACFRCNKAGHYRNECSIWLREQREEQEKGKAGTSSSSSSKPDEQPKN